MAPLLVCVRPSGEEVCIPGRVTVRRNRVPVAGGEVVETSTKTHRVRVIDIDADTVDVLRVMLRDRLGNRESYVFVADVGEPLHPHAVSYLWQLAVRSSVLRHIGVHGLRHTHFSQLVAEGQSIPMAAERGGWVDSHVLMKTYAHGLPGEQEAAVLSMSRYARKRLKGA